MGSTRVNKSHVNSLTRSAMCITYLLDLKLDEPIQAVSWHDGGMEAKRQPKFKKLFLRTAEYITSNFVAIFTAITYIEKARR